MGLCGNFSHPRKKTVGRLRASCYEQGSLISHFVPLFWMNVVFSLIPEKLKICSIHREQLREFNSSPHEETEGWISN